MGMWERPTRGIAMRLSYITFAVTLGIIGAGQALALDLNAFRALHGRAALSSSVTLSGIASAHANDMAARNHLDHNGFRQRIGAIGTAHAENVLWGCEDEDCAIRMWARSGGHRVNMLRGDVSAYGLASAKAANGRHYWVLELGGE
jgi:uncharacterized protein YkwD